MLHGVSRGDAAAKVVELYSPPRVTAELGRLPHMSLVGGPTFDLRSGANGVAWDFCKADHRRRAREQFQREEPFLVIGSPPCTDFCSVQNLNRHCFSPAEVQRRRTEAMALLGFAVEICWLQLGAGRHFLHEHPAAASSWRERIVLELRHDERVGEVVGTSVVTACARWGPMASRALPRSRPASSPAQGPSSSS